MEVECVPVEDESRLAELRFDAAVKVIKSLPPNGSFQPSNDMMLKFYSYYKQATIGACNIPRPGFWDAVGRAKWGAWNSLGNMSKEEAMVSYVNEIKLILEGMPMTIEVEKFLRAIGPFYELVDEKKKISQVSDLSAGFSTTVNSAVTKSIIRSMEMNGSLESGPAALKSKEGRESEEDDEEEEETTRKASSQPKKKDPTRKHRTPLSNGKVANGDPHLSNGGHSRSTLNSEDSQDEKPLSNGHHADPSANVSSPSQLASDSDSEVYCDSVDQFGQEENSERNCSLDGLEDVESQVLAPVEESQGEQEFQEEQQVPPQVITYGGEDGENGALPSRQRFNENGSSSSAFRRGKGSKSPGLGSGNVAPLRSTGGGDGGRWGGAGKATGSLNEQIVVALARLQDDMQSVLERLHTLEALSASQARSLSLSPTCPSTTPQKNRKPSWWPFDISPPTFAFAIVWPFVVQWLISLYVRRRKRRIN
ncbi:acyl-CoA-binding domain-containing protein 5A [Takifugu rubripes]|uniref:Acyl-CoA-binding domain-containing protein 5 n=1 Tax=Takifugu rubripes TaxID=31033 RepID=H2TR34_TAKRU|nr:acyl-CoA-binding domain-containing protein 5 [Takifugu rubripes]|eukprot:XP_011606412.1 PREDICTED: acyl-CoA-binding domain-containing protein 5 [Takifugu rubripes]